MQLKDFQIKGLEETSQFNRVLYSWDMGLGKSYIGAQKMIDLGAKVNLLVCQKSKINDWIEHFNEYNKPYMKFTLVDMTYGKGVDTFMYWKDRHKIVGVINYDLLFRRPQLLELSDFSLILDESSLIQNTSSKRSKFILKLKPKNVVLLTGTIVNGKYENVISQAKLLGWDLDEELFFKHYIDWEWKQDSNGRYKREILGYKNVDRLKRKLREYGASFLKTDEVMTLPKQTFIVMKPKASKEYWKFRKDWLVTVDGKELVGDYAIKKRLYERQLCGQYNDDKLQMFEDLLNSTDDRLIVFYNFNDELDRLLEIHNRCRDNQPASFINGAGVNLDAYNELSNSVTFVNYQAGAMGHNLQLANKVIYFTLPDGKSDLFEQSKKRVHRIGQDNKCFYYILLCPKTIEESIYENLLLKRDYTDELYKKERDL